MRRTDHSCVEVSEKNGCAIGSQDAQDKAGLGADQCVGMRARIIGPRRSRYYDTRRMDLVGGDERCAGGNRRDGATTILSD